MGAGWLFASVGFCWASVGVLGVDVDFAAVSGLCESVDDAGFVEDAELAAACAVVPSGEG